MNTNTESPKKVLHVLASLERGGVETWLMNVCRYLDWNRVQFDVCLTGPEKIGAYEQEFESLGGKIHRLPLNEGRINFSRRLEQFLKRNCYDVVHSHLYFFSGFVLRSAKRMEVPVRIAHFHHTAPDIHSESFIRRFYRISMYKFLQRYATAVLACSKGAMKAFAGSHWRDNPCNKILYYGINLDKYECNVDRAKFRADLFLPQEAKIVLHIGRYMPLKNHFFIVDIAEQICRVREDVYFVLVGGGDESLHARVEDYVKQKGLTERFRFCGPTSNLMPYWGSADLFLFPSIREGFGMVLIEASAAALPIVASDIPGVREASIGCYEKRILSLDLSDQVWAHAMLEMLEKGRKNQTKAIDYVRSAGFDIQNSVDGLLKIYGVES